MELSYQELDKLILYISTGKKFVNILGKHVQFIQPDNSAKLLSQFVYEQEYNSAIASGILPISELEVLIRKRKIYTEEDESLVRNLESKIEAQEVLLAKTVKVKANSDRIKGIIQNLREQMYSILYKKNSKLVMSAETKADEARHNFLCYKGTYDFDGKPYWGNMEEFLNEKDVSFKMSIMAEYLRFYNGIPTDVIRYIARSNLWRIRYVNSQRVSEELFGVPTVDYSTDQLNLAYWSNYYTNIYEMMPEDRPSDMVIEDDTALDAYMKDLYAERTRDQASRKYNKQHKGKMSAFDKEEVIVTQSNELYQDIEYDKPREAQRLKDKTDIRKRTKRG